MKACDTSGIPVEVIFSPDSRAERLHQALAKTRGLDFVDAYRGLFSLGSECADVRLEPNDSIHVWYPTRLPQSPMSALETNVGLPGNVRFARNGAGVELLADTQADGELHLRETFREIRRGMRLALEKSPNRTSSKAARARLEKQQVQAAFDQLTWDPESLVCHENAWELRPCVSGESLPVQAKLVSDGSALVMRRTILAVLPSPETLQAAASADQALRFNSQLRQVRLSHWVGTLVCEARLHAGQLQPKWLAMTARAVAFASRHVHLPLRVLAEQESVAENYVKMFCSSDDPVALNSVAG